MSQTRVIVAGSRSITDQSTIREQLRNSPLTNEIDILVSGGAKGVDMEAERWAHENGIPVQPFDVKSEMYDEHGKAAPIKRNKAMAKHADALIAIWDGESSGTKRMIQFAKDYNLEVDVRNISTTLDDFP